MWGLRRHVGGHGDGHRQCVKQGARAPTKLLADLPLRNRVGHRQTREYPRRLQNAGGGGPSGRGDPPRTGGGRRHQRRDGGGGRAR